MLSIEKIVAALLLLSGMIALVPVTASAQQKVGFKLSPTTIEEKVDPGVDKQFAISVQNIGQVEATLYPSAQNIIGIGADQHPIYSTVKDQEGYELASWITYEETSLVVQPGESKTLHFTVHFPKDFLQNVLPP